MNKILVSGVLTLALSAASGARADEIAQGLQNVLANVIKPLAAHTQVVEAVRAQNAETTSLDQAAIDALDAQWRAEADAGGGPLIDRVLADPLSAFLKAQQDASDGLFVEVFVMDAKGLNVGQSAITSDYWQGDEAKWQQTFQAGPDAALIDEIDYDDSAAAFLSQVSTAVADPDTGSAIGAITVGVNVEKLPE